MSAPARFKQIDVTRALRGVMDAGMTVSRLEIDPQGRIIIYTAQGASTAGGGRTSWDGVLPNSFDQLMKK